MHIFCLCVLAAASSLVAFASDRTSATDQDVWDSTRRLSERLQHVEGKFDEEQRQRQREKELWRAEKQGWQQERQQWTDDKREWQREQQLLKDTVQSLVDKVTRLESLQHIAEAEHDEDKLRATPEEGSKLGPRVKTPREMLARSDDADPLAPVVSQMSQRLGEVAAEVEALKTNVHSEVQALQSANARQDQAIRDAGSSTFVRWGSSVCPNSTERVYLGTVGGGDWSSSGSTSSVVCLHPAPVFSSRAHSTYFGHLVGGEYSTLPGPHHNLDPVCAVCRSPRPTTLMVPGTNVCEDGWTLEYSGHLMGSEDADPSNHESVCVDSTLEGRHGSEKNDNGMLLYFQYTRCGSLPCPPYQNERMATCAICSK